MDKKRGHVVSDAPGMERNMGRVWSSRWPGMESDRRLEEEELPGGGGLG